MRTEKRFSLQISGDMVSLHNVVSPQNSDTRGGPPPPPPPSDATVVRISLLFYFLISFPRFTALSLSFSINSSKNADSCRTIALPYKSISNRMKPLQTRAAPHREHLYIWRHCGRKRIFVVIRSEFVVHSKWIRIAFEIATPNEPESTRICIPTNSVWFVLIRAQCDWSARKKNKLSWKLLKVTTKAQVLVFIYLLLLKLKWVLKIFKTK